MFDIAWSELILIGVVALIAIGPKELPGVLRTVGQWMGKARRLATEFQGQFKEAMREAEMADLKKSFDEVKDAAAGFTGNNVLTKLGSEVADAVAIDKDNKDTAAPTPAEPGTPAAPAPDSFVAAADQAAVSEPLAIVREAEAAAAAAAAATTLPVAAETHALAPPDLAPPDLAHPDRPKDAKAS